MHRVLFFYGINVVFISENKEPDNFCERDDVFEINHACITIDDDS